MLFEFLHSNLQDDENVYVNWLALYFHCSCASGMDMLRHADEFDWRLTVTGLAYVSRSLIWLMSRGH